MQMQQGHIDKFQPIALIATLRQRMQEVKDNPGLDPIQKENMRLGLAWAICEVQNLAMNRYEHNECPGIDKAQAQHLMKHNG